MDKGKKDTEFELQASCLRIWLWLVCAQPLSPVRLFATSWAVDHQAPPSVEFSWLR